MGLFSDKTINLSVSQVLAIVGGTITLLIAGLAPMRVMFGYMDRVARTEETGVENSKDIRSLQEITDSLARLHEKQAAEEEARRQAIQKLCRSGKLKKDSQECLEVEE